MAQKPGPKTWPKVLALNSARTVLGISYNNNVSTNSYYNNVSVYTSGTVLPWCGSRVVYNTPTVYVRVATVPWCNVHGNRLYCTVYTAYSVYTMYHNCRRLYDLLHTGFSYLSCTPTALDAHADRAVPRGSDILVQPPRKSRSALKPRGGCRDLILSRTPPRTLTVLASGVRPYKTR